MGSVLFEKIKIGSYELKNRFLMSAAAAWETTEEGDILEGQDLIHYKVASGGPALILGGGVNVHASGRHTPTTPLLNDDKRIPSYRYFAETVKKGGAGVAFQLTHSGMWAGYYQLKIGAVPFAPSFLIDDTLCAYHSPKKQAYPATEKQIYEIIEAYGDAAARAKKAGYDALEVHGAHESVLSQFLSPITNIREDDWGGTVENRCRFHCDVFVNIRKKVGPDFPVFIKLGVQDWVEGGLPLEEGITAAKIIAATGDVDAIEVSQGLSASITNFNDTSIKTGITSIEKEGYYRSWTKKVNSALKEIPEKKSVHIIMQGGLRSFELMEEVIKNGEADLVSMCRPYIREPKVINRWKSCDLRKATCISCNKCVMVAYGEGKPLICQIK